MTVPEKLVALRQLMSEKQIDVYIITTNDPHQNEYVSPRYQCLKWVCGFSGSAGTLAISAGFAGLWVDSRYWLAAELALKDTGVQLFCLGKPEVPTVQEWISTSQPAASKVSYDAACMSVAAHQTLVTTLSRYRIQVEPGPDLVHELWTDCPILPQKPLIAYQHPWVTTTYQEKLERIASWMLEQNIQWYLISNTDEIGWILNLRGNDIDFNPVFHAWLLIGLHGHVLFIGNNLLSDNLVQAYGEAGVSCALYHTLEAYLQTLPSEDQILLPPESTNMRAVTALSHLNHIAATSPVPAWKAAKTSTEQAALRLCLERDGLAMVKFLYWLDRTLAEKNKLDEYAIGTKIAQFRSAGDGYIGESFNPIVGYAANGAIVHYHAPETGSTKIGANGLLLIDSGGQYIDGTTDITRVVSIGSPTPSAISAYTLVLKGHIRLAQAVFPVGTFGGQLDILARQALWEQGKNYGHGTGHGIGFFLNVHEGPQRISAGPNSMNAALEVGNVLSNEPGYYAEGQFGVRIENMILVQEDKNHPGFLNFETLTLCPYERTLIDVTKLTSAEKAWVDDYHARIYQKLSNHLTKEEATWLKERTQPL